MKKIANIKTALICFILLLGITQAEARNIYVSPTGASGSSDQGASVGAPVNITRLWAIINAYSGDNELNVYFEGGTYTVTTPLAGTSTSTGYFNRTAFDGKTVTFLGTGTPTNPAIFDGDGSNNQLLSLTRTRSSSNAFSFTMRNIVMQNFSNNSGANNMFEVNTSTTYGYNKITLDSVTITSCNNTTANARLFFLYGNADSELNVSNSSIVGNTRGATTNLMYLQRGTSRVYNNTFSGNTNQHAMAIGVPSPGTRYVFNNTLYNTGTIELTASSGGTGGSFKFLNNITNNSSITLTGSVTLNATNFARNILGSSYYAVGNTSGTSLPNFSQHFSTALTTDIAPGKQVHQLLNTLDASHSVLGQGNALISLSNETGIYLAHDQVGFSRPSEGNIALGAIENHLRVTTRDPQLYLVENLYSGVHRPSSVTIDLKSLVDASAEFGTLSFELNSQMSPVGTLSVLTANYETTFTPASGVFNGTGTFTYKVKAGGIERATGTITVTLSVFNTPPPGYTDPSDFNTCFAYMGAVEFSSAYRFRSQLITGNGTDNRMHGFTVPLVGDLNGDGYPEIVGASTSGTGIYGYFNGIHIYDGRTGRRISLVYFPGCSSSYDYYNTTYHTSPSIMALVDSDRDGKVELIVAFPNESDVPTASRTASLVASFNINYSNGTYTLSENWRSNAAYNSGVTQNNFQKPIPQIVDLDGDGTAEVLVYNKIYSAHPTIGGTSRAPLLTLETLGTTATSAYVGADRGATHGGGGSGGDVNIPFSYVYDMDGDGIYDVVAGGKIYKITKNGATWGYQTISMYDKDNTVVDGRTGVADINGDGIADVVTATRTNATESSGTVSITVWNPGFKMVNASGNIIDNPNFNAATSPHILAQMSMPLGTDGNTQGNNSYIYIGDIDGLEQTVTIGGVERKYRLPEIAILGGPYRFGAAATQHPNVRGAANGIPLSGNSEDMGTGTEGVIAAVTWDADPAITNVSDRLKLSFIMGHDDRSANTGFTMFDFDNDGMQEICYRDEETLRIIKASRPYITQSYTGSDVVLFRQVVQSYTGFEYPVIADIDNDASAEMVVMGHESGSGDARGYIYAVGNGSGDKFAPALPVWNQFMYDPFKINPDLTTPIGPAVNRLDPSFTFKREIKNEDNQVIKTIEEYKPFNGTLTQAPYFMGFETTTGSLNFEPIVFLTEAYIVDNDDPVVDKRPLIEESGSPLNTYIYINIGNRATAETDISANTPISIYKKNKVSKENFVGKYTLTDLYIESSPGVYTSTFGANTISPGQEFRFRIQLPTGSNNIGDIYIVRLGDNSDTTPSTPIWRWGLNEDPDGTLGDPDLGTGQASRQFRDCYWPDQSVRVARYQAIDDAQTVQEFRSVEINIWDNDILPDAFFVNLHIPTADSMLITILPKAGYLTYSGTGRDSRIEYHHDAREVLTGAVDSFHYKIRFWDSIREQFITDSAAVYIYVMESATGGFSACYGATTTVTLANKPLNGVVFNWFDETGEHHIGTGLSRTLQGFIEGDSIYQVQPRITLTPNPYNVEFPKGQLTIALATTSPGATATMRWTGLVDHNWRNPGNWVEIKGTYEAPVSCSPTGCVDVIIPSGVVNYPELIDTATCRNITMKDRAMLVNPHVLKYTGAQVEFKLTPTEKDRFVMWSAPLMAMYSGDYHFKNNATPQWGDVFMSFFQQKNPDDPTAAAAVNHFTATFGTPNASLGLGQAFNLRLDATSNNRDSVFVFPQTTPSYAANGQTYATSRGTNGNKFITHENTLDNSGVFNIPVTRGGAGNTMIQVVNPYMAYLRVSDFLAANNSVLGSGYFAWSGDVNESFISVLQQTVDSNRYVINTSPQLPGAALIPPLKSFFVWKINPATNVITLKMSPKWTTTSGTNPYTLRAATDEVETNVLRIKASQGERTSYAVLLYDPQAHAYYDGKEDVRQLFYDETPLTLYALTPWKEALSIYSDGDFSVRNVDLGLRVRHAGIVTLTFSGMPTFGHDVWLIDKSLGSTVNLQQTPTYSFAVAKTGTQPVELNERFALRMSYTGNGLPTGNETAAMPPQWNVSARDGYVNIQAATTLSHLQIYDLTGALVYADNATSTYFRIPLSQGVYIVKALVGTEYKVEKVWVK